jgi:hypothetical protein
LLLDGAYHYEFSSAVIAKMQTQFIAFRGIEAWRVSVELGRPSIAETKRGMEGSSDLAYGTKIIQQRSHCTA